MSSHLAATVLIAMVPGARRRPIMPIMVAKHETLSLSTTVAALYSTGDRRIFEAVSETLAIFETKGDVRLYCSMWWKCLI